MAGNVIANAYEHHSDFRLKKDIASINNALDKFLALRGVEFEWRIEEYPEKGFAEGRKIGLIAQIEIGFFMRRYKSNHGIKSKEIIE